MAELEWYVTRFKEMLADIIKDTENQVRKKQTLRQEELLAENFKNPKDMDEVINDEDEDGPIYNPKNLPLGWVII